MFKEMQKGLNHAGQAISREATKLGHDIDHAISGVKSSPQLDLFKTGNVVQLISRTSGKCLEIVSSNTGLVVDGMGLEGGSQDFHTHWTVLNEGHNIVHLHNNDNYLSITNGATHIVLVPSSTVSGAETKFRLGQVETFMTFESLAEPGSHIGVLSSGQLKSAVASGKELDAQFGVRLIYTPYTTTTTNTTNGTTNGTTDHIVNGTTDNTKNGTDHGTDHKHKK